VERVEDQRGERPSCEEGVRYDLGGVELNMDGVIVVKCSTDTHTENSKFIKLCKRFYFILFACMHNYY